METSNLLRSFVMAAEERVILVAGATGFVGRRLVPALLAEGYRVRCLVRRAEGIPEGAETVVGDLLREETLDPALQGVDSAFYLVHSMRGGRSGFEERDRLSARNFVSAADRSGLRRCIYLGGLGEAGRRLSHHLESRREVAEILGKGKFALTAFRAAIIIGAGGASFEMIRALVERLPVMLTPKWVHTLCQPIAVGDVIRYLVGCLEVEETVGGTFDIGGPDILTYRDMMEKFAQIEGKARVIIPVPFLTPRLSSYWVGLISPVAPSIAIPLIEGLKNEVVCRERRITALIPFSLTSYEEAVRQALAEIRKG